MQSSNREQRTICLADTIEHVFSESSTNPQNRLAMLKINSGLGDGCIQISGINAPGELTAKWITGECGPWDGLSRGLTELVQEFPLRVPGHSQAPVPHDIHCKTRNSRGEPLIAQASLSRNRHPNSFDRDHFQKSVSYDSGVEREVFERSPGGDRKSSGRKSGSSSGLPSYTADTRGTRKRLAAPSGSSEDPSEPSNGGCDIKVNRKNNGSSAKRRCQRYACPFYLTDPEDQKYRNGEEYEKCRTEGVEVAKFKEHIRRKHTKPEQCKRCGIRGEKGIISQHNRNVPECLIPPGEIQKVDQDTLEKDQKLKPKNQSWSQVYKILFPGLPVPDSEFVSPSDEKGLPMRPNQYSNSPDELYWQQLQLWMFRSPEARSMFQQSPEYKKFLTDINAIQDAGVVRPPTCLVHVGTPSVTRQDNIYQPLPPNPNNQTPAPLSQGNFNGSIQSHTMISENWTFGDLLDADPYLANPSSSPSMSDSFKPGLPVDVDPGPSTEEDQFFNEAYMSPVGTPDSDTDWLYSLGFETHPLPLQQAAPENTT